MKTLQHRTYIICGASHTISVINGNIPRLACLGHLSIPQWEYSACTSEICNKVNLLWIQGMQLHSKNISRLALLKRC